jgi:hypothetical protein
MKKASAIMIGTLVGGVVSVIVIVAGLFFKTRTVVLASGIGGGVGAFVAIKLMKPNGRK